MILDEDILTNISLQFDKSKIDKDKAINVLDKVGLLEKFKNNLNDNLGDNGIKYQVVKSKELNCKSSI